MIPLTIAAAKRFVGTEHRHHPVLVGGLWALGAVVDGHLIGVCVIGRPKARAFERNPVTEPALGEVTRLATDGTHNACSFLYARARRVMQAMGYESVKTYTLASESGASLRALGLTPEARVRGRTWSCKSRPRTDKHPTQDKLRWELLTNG